MSSDWLGDGRAIAAAEKILDSAALLFVEKGVGAVGMAEIASAAGCSRATLYRYFENRQALHVAFVHREARTLGAAIATTVASIADPRERLETAILAAVSAVRSTPTLAVWFLPGDASLAGELANSSEVINGLGAAFLGSGADAAQAKWTVRVILSLLMVPGVDARDERALVKAFVAGVLIHT
ncbi:TetR/AcrR family transcriptional regulator [Rhodococcus globerulus]|uniref:TetR/AcrR family transcriptional regulator n=1 Tax=Rhodococcus globerulus TaxID=33008 RepID=UPI001F28EF08|nr:TetR/AcrR family transcriptional regulator [Rhodococcus globerulus]MCE4266533.1 TetR/AcrR family transcriptional regulator [Rhodococcus globerulus]